MIHAGNLKRLGPYIFVYQTEGQVSGARGSTQEKVIGLKIRLQHIIDQEISTHSKGIVPEGKFDQHLSTVIFESQTHPHRRRNIKLLLLGTRLYICIILLYCIMEARSIRLRYTGMFITHESERLAITYCSGLHLALLELCAPAF